MTDMNDKNYFLELLNKAYEGTISPDEVRALNERIQTDDEAAALYVEFFDIVSGLVDLNEIALSFEGDDSTAYDVWINYLAQDEIHAPAIELPRHKPEPLNEAFFPASSAVNSPRKVNKWSIVSAVFSAAALLFMAVLIRFAPERSYREVATLVNSMNAGWTQANVSMLNGTRFLSDGKFLFLREGLAELQFDSNVRIVLEAPAEFQILSEDRIGLRYGRVYAVVPQEAIGFSIYTANAKIIDLGTEFGVQADINGDTILHVIKGSTRLIAGAGVGNKSSIEVVKGDAKKVARNSAEISTISLEERHFARAFDSVNNIVWRQQPSLDLADIVRAGNGTGTGNSTVRLDPIKGFTSDWHLEISAAKGYLRIQDSPFIDGIFIPNGRIPQIVSSRNDMFEECPETNGLYYIDLFANPTPKILWTEESGNHTIYFDGQEYSDQGKSCIVMHGNHGITFDLDAIRRHYGRRINRFVSRVGIADFAEGSCSADFYVLLDGRPCYSLRRYKQKGVLNDLSVAIEDTNRFLTLVTTAGLAPDKADGDISDSAFLSAWSIFTEPVLLLE